MLTTRVGDASDAAAAGRLWTAANLARTAALEHDPRSAAVDRSALDDGPAATDRSALDDGTPAVDRSALDDGSVQGDAPPPGGPAAGVSEQVAHAVAEARVRRMLTAPGSLIVLAEQDGDPVAMALIVQALAQDGASADPLPGVTHVTMVAVHPAHWRRGLGGAVVTRAEAEARRLGYTRAQLWTQQSNERAHHLYTGLGWILSGRSKTDDHGEQIRHYTRDL
ncbi:GNAT family N-acetyltransferase [Dactylosporangium sp. NPDC005555]|uniref:GNAT family N-acetyltransferase n=1 Tax=Dactylosporangium sp. NPDC005555 TaxID=3154889 RepID=UPI0033AB0BE8